MNDEKDKMCMYIFSKSFEQDKGCTNNNCHYIHPYGKKSGFCKFVTREECHKNMYKKGATGALCENYHMYCNNIMHDSTMIQNAHLVKYDNKHIGICETSRLIHCYISSYKYFVRASYQFREKTKGTLNR